MHSVHPSDIPVRLSTIAADIFDFSVDAYLASNNSRSLFFYAIDLPTRSFLPVSGQPPQELTDLMNGRFVDAMAGYRVAVQSVFPASGVNADVLLLSSELLSATPADIDTILLHELCHMLIDSKSREPSTTAIDEKSRYHGERLYKKTDVENEAVTRHSPFFCSLLSMAAEKYATQYKTLADRWEVIDSAMRYDLRRNART